MAAKKNEFIAALMKMPTNGIVYAKMSSQDFVSPAPGAFSFPITDIPEDLFRLDKIALIPFGAGTAGTEGKVTVEQLLQRLQTVCENDVIGVSISNSPTTYLEILNTSTFPMVSMDPFPKYSTPSVAIWWG